MSVASVTWGRTIGQLRSRYTTVFVLVGYLAVAAGLFARAVALGEGGNVGLAVLWTLAAAQPLPALAALLAMGSVSDETQSGRLSILLSTAIRERDIVFGKFFGVWSMQVFAALLFGALVLPIARVLSPAVFVNASPLAFLPGVVVLALQSALWAAFAIFASALTRRAAVAALLSLLALIVLPRAVWAALMAFAAVGQPAFGEMPIDVWTIDMASGVVSSGALVPIVLWTGVFLFSASKMVAAHRLIGRGARLTRFTTCLAILLSLAFAFLGSALALRTNVSIDCLSNVEANISFSPRMRALLDEAGGGLNVSVLLSRSDPSFRSVSRTMRALQRESAMMGGAPLRLSFVDPHWNVGAAERLIRLGAAERSVVFERGRRCSVLPLEEGYGERMLLSAVQRVVVPLAHRNVYWTVGHGEGAFDDYGPTGYSDIARDVFRSGYRNFSIDLSRDVQIPSDCALLIIADARNDFSRFEIGRIDQFLKLGGRLLVLSDPLIQPGIASLLSTWGVLISARTFPEAPTLSGTDVLVSDFSTHAVAHPLVGSRIVLERPLSYAPSAAISCGNTGADGLAFTPLASVAGQAVAAVVERGVGAGKDLLMRPTRIVVVGDASFVMNGQLDRRANANRDFFLNAVAFLSGTDIPGARGVEPGLFTSGLDRMGILKFVLMTVVAAPLALLLIGVVYVYCRRNHCR